MKIKVFCLLVWLIVGASVAFAQTTAFTYQGKLSDASQPANGAYDFQFKLFDAASGGAQVGSTVASNGVTVSGGLFTVTLDFGVNVFPGAPRFLEISVRQVGVGAFTTLSPRHAITSTPYAVQSLNAASATTAVNFSGTLTGAVTGTQTATTLANNAVTTTKLADGSVTDAKISSVAGSKISGPIPVAAMPAGSSNYIQNNTAQQAGVNFNISGDGSAGGTLAGNIVNALTQYHLGGSRVLSSPGTNNLFVGLNAAATGPAGVDNTYVGNFAGNANTTGDANSFFGVSTGYNNQGTANSFFGRSAGFQNTTGSSNSFFGVQAGRDNCGAGCNGGNGEGSNNSFFGRSAGISNTTGSYNTFIGSNTSITSLNGRTGSFNTLVGYNSSIVTLSFLEPIHNATAIGAGATAAGNRSTAIGADAFARDDNTIVIGTNTDAVKVGILLVSSLANYNIPLCRTPANTIADCSSSLRYKTGIVPYSFGLNLINRLRPISFVWKNDGTPDFGLGAEEVAAAEPLLTFQNNRGEIEGVKYAHLSVVLVNAVKEQQVQIETQAQQIAAQQTQLKHQQQQLDALRKLVCQSQPQAAACQE